MDQQDETRLVELARNQDADAFAKLYSTVYKDLYRFAFYVLGNPEDAEDLVMETVADAFSDIRKLRTASSFRPWIFRILTNKCKMMRKRYLQKPTALTVELPVPDRNYAEIQDVRDSFAKLNENERLIISLTVFAGYTNEEAARLMKMKSGTLRSIKSRAMDKLEADLFL